MIFKDIAILDENFCIKEHQHVEVTDDKISYIGESLPSEDVSAHKIIDGRKKLMIPGLVNAHTHVPMTLLRGYGENLPLDRWLNERIFPYEHQLDAYSVSVASYLGIAEMLRFGITSFTEMYDFCDEIAEAVFQTGIKANISRGVLCFDGSALSDLPSFRESEELYRNWHNAANGRILVDMCIHSEYTSTPRIVSQMAEYAKSLGCHMHIHLAETKKETEDCIARHGITPAQYMEKMGVFENPTTAAHCVYTTPEDRALLAEKGVTVAHCPISNLKLGSGIAAIPELMEANVNIALGTDGCASNNTLNIMEELRLTAILHKGVSKNPTICSPDKVLSFTTINGAKAQGRTDTGLLKVGYKADFAIVDCDRVYMNPCHDALSNLVYAAQGSDVVMTVVDGKILYQDGEYTTIDIEKITAECLRMNEKILNNLS